MIGRLDLAAEFRGERLHAVTDAKHWRAGGQQRIADLRRALRSYGFGAARQNDAFRRECGDLLRGRIPGQDLAVDADLAYAARDELRVLAAEIDDENALCVTLILTLRGQWLSSSYLGAVVMSRRG